jgi:carbon monoxide dehydrogenase subunit G
MIQLHHQFQVGLPVDRTWDLLTDLPKVARCLPGASLDEVVEGEYRGGMSTRIGPISAKYRGTASFREQDEVSHRAVIEARGREEKGSGSASALITAVLKPDGQGTLVDVSTELTISGRAAQFGRSLVSEVSNTMIDEFVRRLEAMIRGDSSQPTQHSGTPVNRHESSGETTAADSEPDQLNVLTTIVLPMLRKSAIPIGAALLAGVIGVAIGCRRQTRSRASARIPLTYVLPYPGHHDNRSLEF